MDDNHQPNQPPQGEGATEKNNPANSENTSLTENSRNTPPGNQNVKAPPKRKYFRFKVFIPVLALLVFLTGYLFTSSQSSIGSKDTTRPNLSWESFIPSKYTQSARFPQENYIGLVEVNGVILESMNINKQLLRLRDNPQVKGIIIRVNSPGGAVASSQEIYDMIQDISQLKKIYISMGDVAASGGLYIAMGANKIFANPGSVTGSIGVIIQSYNVEKLMTNAGVQSIIYKSGKQKDILSLFRAPSDEEKDILQSLVNDTYSQFINAVASGRGMTAEEVEEIADGRIFNGHQALNVGLIDGLKSFQGVFDEIKDELNIPDAVLFDSRESLDELLEYMDRWVNQSSGQNIINKLNPGIFFVMPGWYLYI